MEPKVPILRLVFDELLSPHEKFERRLMLLFYELLK